VFSPHARATVKAVALMHGPVEIPTFARIRPVDAAAFCVRPNEMEYCIPASMSPDKIKTRFPEPDGPMDVVLSTCRTPDEFHQAILDAEPLRPLMVILEAQQRLLKIGTLVLKLIDRTIGEQGSVALS